MISEPRERTTISMFVFCTALILVGIVPFQYYVSAFPKPSFWSYSFIFFWVFGVGLIIRWFLTYKTITTGNGKIVVFKKYLKTTKIFELSQLKAVKEERINTFSAPYRLLILQFPNGLLEISEQEYTNYEKLKNYVEKNIPKKK
jgi:hypothetical protein